MHLDTFCGFWALMTWVADYFVAGYNLWDFYRICVAYFLLSVYVGITISEFLADFTCFFVCDIFFRV